MLSLRDRGNLWTCIFVQCRKGVRSPLQLSVAINVRLRSRLTFPLRQVALNTPCLSLHLQKWHTEKIKAMCFFYHLLCLTLASLFTCSRMSVRDILPSYHIPYIPAYSSLPFQVPCTKAGRWLSGRYISKGCAHLKRLSFYFPEDGYPKYCYSVPHLLSFIFFWAVGFLSMTLFTLSSERFCYPLLKWAK